MEKKRSSVRTEMRMVRWMSGVSLRERKTNNELQRTMGIEPVMNVVKRNRMRWLGHVLRKDESDWVRGVMEMNVEGSRGRGRPRRTWLKKMEEEMKAKRLVKGMQPIGKNGEACHGARRANPCFSREDGLKTSSSRCCTVRNCPTGC